MMGTERFRASQPTFLATIQAGLLGLGLEAKFSGLGLEAFGLGLVFLALALFKAKVNYYPPCG